MLRWIPGFCVFAITLVSAHPASTDDEWLRNVAELRNTGRESFQFQADIRAGPEQLTADVSCAEPDRRCVVLRDSFDGVPLMIATDGVVWLYDAIGGQILKIGAEPSFKAGREGGPLHVSWGMRADFPDVASYTTIRLEFGAILNGFAKAKPANLSINRATRTAEYAEEKITMKLTVDQNDPTRPTEFTMDSDDGKRRTFMRCTSFVYGARVPKWHREIDQAVLSKHLVVRAVRDTALFPADVQEKMGRIRSLLNGGGLFAIRGIMRDSEVRGAFEKNSPVRIDFDKMHANDKILREKWLEALREQRMEFPDAKAKALSK